MILFIGDRDKGYWCEQVASKYGMGIGYVPASLHIDRQVDGIMRHNSSFLVFDLIQYEDDAKKLGERIAEITSATNAVAVIYAGAEFLPDSKAVTELRANGITAFIYADDPGGMKTELENIISMTAIPKSKTKKAGGVSTARTRVEAGGGTETRTNAKRQGTQEEDDGHSRLQGIEDTVSRLTMLVEQTIHQNRALQQELREQSMRSDTNHADGLGTNGTEPVLTPHKQDRATREAVERHARNINARKYEEAISRPKKVSVGLVGSMPRIGTTTQAVQIVKYLVLHGHKACYIELNGNGFVRELAKWYECEMDERMGRATFAGVDMYYNDNMIQEIQKMDYEYLVYDYGSFGSSSFSRASFQEKDIQVFVLGSAVNELDQTYSVLSNTFYKDARYLYNLVPESEKRTLLDEMEEKAGSTYFAPVAPDMFSLTDKAAYDGLFHMGKAKPKEQKKTPFWKRKGGD